MQREERRIDLCNDTIIHCEKTLLCIFITAPNSFLLRKEDRFYVPVFSSSNYSLCLFSSLAARNHACVQSAIIL